VYGRIEERTEGFGLVTAREVAQGRRHREHDVKVPHGQNLGASGLLPSLGPRGVALRTRPIPA